ncbi:MAG: prenyltransferase/squalene oxidase repeat-containing protein [Promethearchaeota archaeon]
MKTSKIRIILIFTLIIIITLSLIPSVLAKPRKTYITDFLYECEIKDKGFANSVESDNHIVSKEATAYALEILKEFNLLQKKDLFGTVEHEVNTTHLPEELESNAESEVNSGDPDIYKLYFLLRSLYLLEDTNKDYEVGSSVRDNIKTFVDSLLQKDGGYSASKSSTTATMASTYFALKIYDLLDKSYANKSITKSWIRSCQNSDGGYGGNIGLSSTILNTYYAIFSMDEIEDVDELLNKAFTINYLQSFLEDDENDVDNYGGYYPDKDAENTMISSTYYCIMGISLIDDRELEHEEDTLTWILNRQNFKDGGFKDIDDKSEQKYSSVVNSYYALELINLIDPDAEATLNQEVFMVEFNWWILVGILIGIGVIAVAIIIIRRKRRI